jgi:DNA-binding MarR family transcriptional regulator
MPAVSNDMTGEVVTLWMQTAKMLSKRILCQSDKKSVNPQQMYAMYIIGEHTGITMKELATQLGITSPSATSLVNRLVRMKWVSRSTDPHNRRLVRLQMASDGKKIMRLAMKEREKAMHDTLFLLTVEDRNDFARILRNLHSALTPQ